MNVLVTGSSRGIGRAIAVRLAPYGGTVVINYLQNEHKAEETAELVRAAGGQAVVVQANVRDEKDLKRLAATLPSYDAIIHNAAIGVLKPWDKIRSNQWDLTLESSVRPMWLLSKHVGDRLVEGGSIIGLSSLGSRRHVPGYAAMGAAKGALEALTRQLAVELAVRKVRVNTVCGGLVDTDALDYFPDKDKLIETANLLTPLGRIGQPDDIAKAVELLLLPQASWITGQVLVADGGWSII
jgi:enoyl-[acyl-carrier protein] reductase III